MSVAREIHAVLRRHQVSRVYCVPGESYLALLDQFHTSAGPVLVSTRHEEGAGIMAEAHAKLTGELGVVLVTRGPGLTHLSIALHTARQDSTPLLAIVGQVPTGTRHREAFQEVDVATMGGTMAKWAVEIPSADRATEIVEQAVRIARTGRPGPVVVALPEDIDRAISPAAPYGTRIARDVARGVPRDSAIRVLEDARTVAIIAGRPVSGRPAVRDVVARLADALEAPVYNAWRRFDAFDNQHPKFAGNIPILTKAGARTLGEADAVVVVDDRLDEFTSLGYSIPSGEQQVLLVGGEGSGLESADDYAAFLDAVSERIAGSTRDRSFVTEASELSRQFLMRGSEEQLAGLPADHPAALAQAFAEALPSDAIVTSDAGTFASWLYRACSFTERMRFLGPTAGGMGYAVPSAIAASLGRPDVPVLAIAGDGGFAMTMSELETASRESVGGIGVFVFDNESYGTIAAHQDRNFPGRRIGTALGPIDYANVASSFGWEARTVRSRDEMTQTLDDLVTCQARILVHVPMPREELDPLGFEWPADSQEPRSERMAVG